MTDAELEALDKKVKRTGMTREVFTRRLLTGCKVYEAPPVDLKKLTFEINRVGSNIDQILTIAHTKDILDVPRLRRNMDELEAVEDAMWQAFAPDK